MNKIRFDKHIDIDSIPTLPAIAMEAIRLMEGDQSNFSSIADLLQNDQVLSGRILHYANSAFVGSRTEITTISRARSLLGFTTVRSIILSVAVFDCFSGQLASRRDVLDRIMLGFAQELKDADLDSLFEYKSTKGVQGCKNFYGVLMHFFNHQTHHRGQATTLFTQCGVDVGATDLILLLPNADGESIAALGARVHPAEPVLRA